MMLEKLSADQVNDYMIKAAGLLRAQQAQIHELEGELVTRGRRDHAEKIASHAVDRGIMSDDDAKTYAEHLVESDEDLKMVEDFVGRAAAGVPLGATLEKQASAEDSGGEADVLTAFLLSSPYAG
jgi:hypothetical protein